MCDESRLKPLIAGEKLGAFLSDLGDVSEDMAAIVILWLR